MLFCPVLRPSLLQTPGRLPSGLARQQCLSVDVLKGNGLSTFFQVLKFLLSWSWASGAQALLANLDIGIPWFSSLFHLGAQGLLTGNLRLCSQ